MPPRSQWLRINRSKRFIRVPGNWSGQQIATSSLHFKNLKYTIRKHREIFPDKSYIINLNNYITRIKSICAGETDFLFSKPAIIPKIKEENEYEIICRPICKYDSLDDKIMLNLTNQYLLSIFDRFFHENIFSYRIKRHFSGEWKVTNQHDAFRMVKEYLEEHSDDEIYVAECDIRKFFDILNHKVIRREFEELINQFPESETIKKLFNSYIDSYSYYSDVSQKNNDRSYWSSFPISPEKNHKTRKFDWVDRESFIKNNAYTEPELENDISQIGTPQGGSLSLFISNLVLNSVDKVIINNHDTNRLFVRYGDDILLMHTNRARCEELIRAYKQSLTSKKLLYHPFKAVSEFKTEDKITSGYWTNKSKSVYKWGKGSGDSAFWIGFVGYEISRDGDIRIRKSTLASQFSRINKAYHSVRKLKAPERKKVMRFTGLVAENISFANYKTIRSKLFADSFRELNHNRYSTTQIKALDRYRNRKFRKLKRQFQKAGFSKDIYLGKPFSYFYHFIKDQCVL